MSAFVDGVGGIGAVVLLAGAVVVGLSLRQLGPPATPPFARPRTTSSTLVVYRDTNATFLRDRGFLFLPRWWFTATCCPPQRIRSADYQSMLSRQWQEPVGVARYGSRKWWMFEGRFYWEAAGYTAADVMALVRDKERRARNRLDRAHQAMRLEQQPRVRRTSLTRQLRRAVFERDDGQCVECGSTFDLQYDHIIPVAKGGATSLENLQLLCSACNQAKGANL